MLLLGVAGGFSAAFVLGALDLQNGGTDDSVLGHAAKKSSEEPWSGRDDVQLPNAILAAPLSTQRTTITDTEAEETQGFVDVFAMPLPDEADLERRYKGMDAHELTVVKRCLLTVVNSEAKAFLKKKMERGLYTTQVLAQNTEVSFGPATFPDGAIRSTNLVTTHLPDGSVEVKLAEIHPSEQPILAARHAEIEWVSKRIADLGGTGQ